MDELLYHKAMIQQAVDMLIEEQKAKYEEMRSKVMEMLAEDKQVAVLAIGMLGIEQALGDDYKEGDNAQH